MTHTEAQVAAANAAIDKYYFNGRSDVRQVVTPLSTNSDLLPPGFDEETWCEF